MNFQELMFNFSWRSLVDICVVAFLFYQVMSALKGTRAAQIMIGLAMVFLVYIFSSYMELETLNWIISKFFSASLLLMIVLFQDDLRRILARVARSPFVSFNDASQGQAMIQEIVSAAKTLSHDRIGALIVFERSVGLSRLYDHSLQIDSIVSEQLLISIFQSFSPLHDGAVIIRKYRLACASAQLPLSKNPLFSKRLGTRHSAAVGISEESDSLVLVVSEETGAISLAWDGQLKKMSSAEAASRQLIALLLPQRTDSRKPFKDHLRDFAQGIRGKMSDARDPDRRRPSYPDRRAPEFEGEEFSTGSAVNIKLPKYGRLGTLKMDGTNMVMTNKDVIAAEDFKDIPDRPYDGSGLAHNKAAEALNNMCDKDKLIPPFQPNPPPRDILIGGISMNPPLESEPIKTQSVGGKHKRGWEK